MVSEQCPVARKIVFSQKLWGGDSSGLGTQGTVVLPSQLSLRAVGRLGVRQQAECFLWRGWQMNRHDWSCTAWSALHDLHSRLPLSTVKTGKWWGLVAQVEKLMISSVHQIPCSAQGSSFWLWPGHSAGFASASMGEWPEYSSHFEGSVRDVLNFHSSHFLLLDIVGLSQISCAFYSLESRVGIRYCVDLLPTENGSTDLEIALSFLYEKLYMGYYVGSACLRQCAFCSSIIHTDYTSEEATSKPCCSLGARAGRGRGDGWQCRISTLFLRCWCLQHCLFTITQYIKVNTD